MTLTFSDHIGNLTVELILASAEVLFLSTNKDVVIFRMENHGWHHDNLFLMSVNNNKFFVRQFNFGFHLIFWIFWKFFGKRVNDEEGDHPGHPFGFPESCGDILKILDFQKRMVYAGDHPGSPTPAFFEHFEPLARGRTFSRARPRKWVFFLVFLHRFILIGLLPILCM